jgi:hypothetical protein
LAGSKVVCNNLFSKAPLLKETIYKFKTKKTVMRTPKILFFFAHLGDVLLNAFAATVLAAMTGNAYFPGATALLVTLADTKKDFSEMLDKSELGNKVDIQQKKVLKKLLVTALRELAAYVTFTAGTDRAAFVSSGYKISKEVNTPRVLPATFDVKLCAGINEGELIVKVARPAMTSFMMIAYTTDAVITNNTAWLTIPCVENNCTLVNLTSGAKVWVKVSLAGSRRQVVTSPAIQSGYIQ